MESLGLKALTLIRKEAFIGGKWMGAISNNKYTVTNPSTNKILAEVSDLNEKDTEMAINSAYEAFQSWKNTTGKERSAVLRNWFNLMQKHSEDLSVILAAETGKPLTEARGELTYGASFLEWFSEEAKRIYGEVATSPSNNKEMIFIKQPIGVIGMITPWNFPNAMITRKAGAALAAGCTCILKPAEDTPLSALAIAVLAEEAGVPHGVFNVVTSSRKNAAAIGNILCTSSKVAGISFTGSTVVGKILYKQSASTMKRLSLELGGNAPFIVFNSAKLDTAIDGLMVAKFRNAGQACISANRIFVQSEIHDQFVEALKIAIGKRLIAGDCFEKDSTLGPLINQSQFQKVDGIVKESIKVGAALIIGGKQHAIGGLFYEPTILTNCTSSMPCFKQEIFGPVVSIQKFETEEEVLKEANASRSGLAGYVFSCDISQVLRVARKLETGMVGVNEGLISAPEGAFGGVKESGLGREGSHHGIDDFIDLKYICIGDIFN